MKNVKDEVYQALLTVTENVSDSYPQDWVNIPTIQYMEEDNHVNERVGNKEATAYVRFRIDIWHNVSTSETACRVDEAVSALGLVRTLCQDANDPSGLKHKVMRYEGIIDINDDTVYWNN